MGQKHKLQDAIPSLGLLLRVLWPYFRGKYLLLAGSILAMLLEVVFRLLEPWPLKWVVDQISGKG
ncbi:MAG TPA: ABC transporter ATP-binding protein, partial [Acidobacteriota bacterium]